MPSKTLNAEREEKKIIGVDIDNTLVPYGDLEPPLIIDSLIYLADRGFVKQIEAEEISNFYQGILEDSKKHKERGEHKKLLETYRELEQEATRALAEGIENTEEKVLRHGYESYVRERLVPKIDNNIVEAIEIAKEAGYYTLLESLNPVEMGEVLISEEYLDMDQYKGLEVRKKTIGSGDDKRRIYTGVRNRDLSKRGGKDILFEELEREFQEEGKEIDWGGSIIIEDRSNKELDRVGHPILKNPSEEVKKKAIDKGYIVVEDSEKIPEYVKDIVPGTKKEAKREELKKV